MFASNFWMKRRGRTCNTGERHSAKTAKEVLGQEEKRRPGQRRAWRGWKGRGRRQSLGRCLPCRHLGHSALVHPWLLLPTADWRHPGPGSSMVCALPWQSLLVGHKEHMEKALKLQCLSRGEAP